MNGAIESGTYAGLFIILLVLLFLLVVFGAILAGAKKSSGNTHQHSIPMEDCDNADWESRHPGNAAPEAQASKRGLYH